MTGTNGNGTGGSGARRASDPGRPAHVHGRPRVRSSQARDGRTLLLRLPVIAGLAAALAGGVIVDRSRDEGAADAPGPPEPVASLMPTSAPADARSSTWYCTAGTAAEDGMADHTVVLMNPTGSAREATLTIHSGDMVGRVAVDRQGASPSSATSTTVDPGDEPTDGTTTTSPTRTAAVDPVVERVDVPPGGEVAVRLGDVVEAPLAAAVVEVDGGDVAVTHEVRGPHGRDAAPCSNTASQTWQLVWGSTTRDAHHVVVLFNPYPSTATVDAVFATEDGGREPVRLQGLPVPGRSVVGIDLGDDVARSEQVAGTFRVRSGNVVVEHLQEYDGSLGTRGLSITPAVPSVGETWVFADGAATFPAPDTPDPEADVGEEAADDQAAGSDERDQAEDAGSEGDENDQSVEGGSDTVETDEAEGDGSEDGSDQPAEPDDDEPVTTERIVIYNPTDDRADVEVRVVPTSGDDAPSPQPFGLSIGAGDHEVVDYGLEARVPAGDPHGTVVRSTNGVSVVAGRVTSDRGPVVEPARSRGEAPQRRSEITATTGARLAAPTWRFPSLAEPDVDGTRLAFVAYNPDPDTPVEVRLGLRPTATEDPDASDEDGNLAVADRLTVPPGERAAIEVDATSAASAAAAILTADAPVVAERVIVLSDGRRQSLGGGVPSAKGAIAPDDLLPAG
jgi:hypothetical protein